MYYYPVPSLISTCYVATQKLPGFEVQVLNIQYILKPCLLTQYRQSLHRCTSTQLCAFEKKRGYFFMQVLCASYVNIQVDCIWFQGLSRLKICMSVIYMYTMTQNVVMWVNLLVHIRYRTRGPQLASMLSATRVASIHGCSIVLCN